MRSFSGPGGAGQSASPYQHAAPIGAPRAARAWPRCLLVAGVLLTASAATAKSETYELDPVHTRVAFQVSHAGFSNPVGSFSGSSGSLQFDDKDWSSARLDVRVPIARLELGDAEWEEKILDRTFFDAKKFPEARFVSTRVEPTGQNSALVTGDLSLRGVTRPLTLKVTLNALKRHPLTLKKTAGFSATGTLSRKEFGISAWKSVVGDEVKLIIEAEALRSNDDSDPREDAEPDTREDASEPDLPEDAGAVDPTAQPPTEPVDADSK